MVSLSDSRLSFGRILLTVLAFLIGIGVALIALHQDKRPSGDERERIRQRFSQWKPIFENDCRTDDTFRFSNEFGFSYVGVRITPAQVKSTGAPSRVPVFRPVLQKKSGTGSTFERVKPLKAPPLKAPDTGATYWKLTPGEYRISFSKSDDSPKAVSAHLTVFMTHSPRNWQKTIR